MFRRARWLLLLAIVVLTAVVAAVFLTRRKEQARERPVVSAPLPDNTASTAEQWEYDVRNGDEVRVRMRARSFSQIREPSTFLLSGVEMEVRQADKGTYDLIRSAAATFDTGSGQLYSDGDVEIQMGLPLGGGPAEKRQTIRGSGVYFDTKTERTWTSRHTQIETDNGVVQGDGAVYEPAAHTIELQQAVRMSRPGREGVPPMEVEASHGFYRGDAAIVELRAPVKLKRGTLNVDGADTQITLKDGEIDSIDSSSAQGYDELPKRRVEFGGDRVKIAFVGESIIQKIECVGAARVQSRDVSGRIKMNADRLDLDFVADGHDSQLSHALGTGHARVESQPTPATGKDAAAGQASAKAPAAKTASSSSHSTQPQGPRILTSEKIDLTMRPGGEEIDQVRTLAAGRLEFLPARPGDSRRQLDGSRITILYGEQNLIKEFRATSAVTRTETPAKPQPGAKPKPAVVSTTRSKDLIAHFDAKGQLTTMDQRGDFMYEEEGRKARADSAQLDESTDVMLLRTAARTWDETGSTDADEIRIDRKTGTSTAKGHVASTRLPDRMDAKPAKDSKDDANANAGLIDNSQPLLGKSDAMTAWDHNRKIRYTGNAVLWQSATRIQGKEIFIDRDTQRLEAQGDVVTRVLDTRQQADPASSSAPGAKAAPPASQPRGFSVIYSPEFIYDGKLKRGLYRENVRLERPDLDQRSRFLQTFFEDSPKPGGGTETKLEHMEADGSVEILQHPPGHIRRGRAEHAEYYPAEDKLILSGGQPEISDPERGVSRGPKITWLAREDRFIVEGETQRDRVHSRTTKGAKK